MVGSCVAMHLQHLNGLENERAFWILLKGYHLFLEWREM
ncbi:hypothetical protein X798_00965, partial [Onchocerca flexuosa]